MALIKPLQRGDNYQLTTDKSVEVINCFFFLFTEKESGKSYELFRRSFEMWLRSRCGGDIDETRINTNLLTLSSYLDFAAIHSQTTGNLYDFCDISFCDYQMVYDFLIDLRVQAKVGSCLLSLAGYTSSLYDDWPILICALSEWEVRYVVIS